MAQENIITLNRDTRWVETILGNGAHFVVSFPVEEYSEEKKTVKVYCRRQCPGYMITKEETLEITDAAKTADLPFVFSYKGEAPVDVFVEVGKTLTKRITFVY